MIGPLCAAAAALLALAGCAKVHAPRPAAAVIAALLPPRLRPARRVLAASVRIGGAGEVLIAVGVVAVGGRISAALLAGCYLVFTGVAVRLTRSGRQISCGCFGRASSPVGRAHIVLDVGCAAVALAAVVRPVPAGADLFGDGALVTVVGCGQVLLLAWLGYLSFTALPALASARRFGEAPR